MKRRSIALLCAAVGLCLSAACAPPRNRLVVYTAAEADQLPAYAQSFRRAHPEIDLVWVRDSTGVVTSKLLAEGKAPRADVVFGLAVTSLDVLDRAGLIAPYAPKGLARLKPRFRDTRTPPHVTGTALVTSIVCLNPRLLAAKRLPTPSSWEDLTRPVYRGALVMPDPTSSGTGLLTVSSWLQIFGEARAWDFMERLDRNIVSYVHSGSKPCRDASRGEAVIGIGLDSRAAQAKASGLPMEIITPTEGVGWDFEAAGLVRGARHPDAGRAFLDWSLSDEAMSLYAKNYSEVSAEGPFQTSPMLPKDLARRLAPTRLAYTTDNRTRILKEWSRRFAGRGARTP